MAGQVAGTLFAAVAFSGSSYLFKMLDKDDYAKEAKRHNEAMENLSKAKEKFYENEVKYHDRIQEYKEQLRDANDDLVATNKSLALLKKVQTITYNGRTFNREPRLDDFYKPSKKAKEYGYLFTTLAGGAGGLILYGLKTLII